MLVCWFNLSLTFFFLTTTSSYHPGTVDGIRAIWTCCGKSSVLEGRVVLSGCTRCDHSDRYNTGQGILAYRIVDAEISALLDPLPQAIRIVEQNADVIVEADRGRWSAGTYRNIVSKRDREQQQRMTIDDNMREQDAMAVPRARPAPPPNFVHTQYLLMNPDDDVAAQRGEIPNIDELAAQRSAARVLLTNKSKGGVKRLRTTPTVHRACYVITAAFEPDQTLLRKFIY